MAAIPEPRHPLDPDIRGCHHIIWTDAPTAGADGRAATAIHPGWVDRSPCGTGTSARMAALQARGELAPDTPYVHESIISTRFTGRLTGKTTVGPFAAVQPEITGGRGSPDGATTCLIRPIPSPRLHARMNA